MLDASFFSLQYCACDGRLEGEDELDCELDTEHCDDCTVQGWQRYPSAPKRLRISASIACLTSSFNDRFVLFFKEYLVLSKTSYRCSRKK